MAWLAVDKDGTENIYYLKPERKIECWVAEENLPEYYRDMIELPHGSIKKLIGRKLTWEDEPVELKEE